MWATNILFSGPLLCRPKEAPEVLATSVGTGTGWRGSSASGACQLVQNHHLALLCRRRCRDWPTLTVEHYFTPVSPPLSAPARTVLCLPLSYCVTLDDACRALLSRSTSTLPARLLDCHWHAQSTVTLLFSPWYVCVKLDFRVCLQTVQWS